MITISPTTRPQRILFAALRSSLLSPIFYLLFLLLPGCHRGPQTAAELQQALPRQFGGEIRLEGDAQGHRLIVEPHGFTVRSEHVLAFGRVRYQVLAGGNVLAEGDAGIQGTISTPNLDIRIEQVTDAGESGGEAMKADTFKGSLSADLRTADAEWTNGLGQAMKLKVTATTP